MNQLEEFEANGTVLAGQISKISDIGSVLGEKRYSLQFGDGSDRAYIVLTEEWVKKHSPTVGDYLIVNQIGENKQAFVLMPADVFEELFRKKGGI